MSTIPIWAYPILVSPRAILDGLERARAAGIIAEPPNLWQLSLGVLRMWHRVLFRSETIGTSPGGRVRPGLRARLLANRILRFPFLVKERAIAPLDFTGLSSSRERVIRHLVGAHHDGDQFVYDLEILSSHPGGLEALERAVQAVVAGGARAEWLRDLTVFEGYHESLKDAVERALSEGVRVRPESAGDPDISFGGYLRWCARQPPTPRDTLRAIAARRFTLEGGITC
jgi:hypothetical protein